MKPLIVLITAALAVSAMPTTAAEITGGKGRNASLFGAAVGFIVRRFRVASLLNMQLQKFFITTSTRVQKTP